MLVESSLPLRLKLTSALPTSGGAMPSPSRAKVRCGTVPALSVVVLSTMVGAAVPAAACRWGLCPRCPGGERCFSGVDTSSPDNEPRLLLAGVVVTLRRLRNGPAKDLNWLPPAGTTDSCQPPVSRATSSKSGYSVAPSPGWSPTSSFWPSAIGPTVSFQPPFPRVYESESHARLAAASPPGPVAASTRSSLGALKPGRRVSSGKAGVDPNPCPRPPPPGTADGSSVLPLGTAEYGLSLDPRRANIGGWLLPKPGQVWSFVAVTSLGAWATEAELGGWVS